MGISEYVAPILPSARSVIIFFFVVYIPLYLVSITFFKRRTRKTPFVLPTLLKSRKKSIADKRSREALLRQHFNTKRIPDRVDVVVIGSTLSGMTTAGILARSGLRVLVLERYSIVGGKTIENEMEIGSQVECKSHFGNMKENSVLRLMMNQLTNGALEWAEIEPQFDNVYLCKGDHRRRIGICKDHTSFKNELLQHFPEEQNAIQRYFKLLESMQSSLWHVLWTKVLPRPIVRFMEKIGIFHFSQFFLNGKRSLMDILNELTPNDELKTVLTYYCYITNESANDISFAAYAFRMNQFLHQGGFYPVGGMTEIAFNIIPLIESAKGKVLVGAPVEKLICNEKRVTGVQVVYGTSTVDILAKNVIIAEGALRARQLLGEKFYKELGWMSVIQQPVTSAVTLNMQIWINADPATCGLRSQNSYFLYADQSNNYDNLLNDWLKLSSSDASNQLPPCFMLSSPCAKDPEWTQRYSHDVSLIVVSFVGSLKWISDMYSNTHLKNQFFTTLWTEISLLHPHVKDLPVNKVEFHFDDDTTLSNDVSRYAIAMQSHLRPDTGMRSLLLTGSDVLVGGPDGEMYGALLCASHYLNRNLMSELVQMRRGIEKKNL